ncbi:MAG: N-acetylglucosamine kinase [Defluviitaleaceae bacterium]|nr:N-acetylglucosamine kinase [Defluviitaleaceae bacterium]
MNYILGVDGGNSKTDYLLCREDGTFVDILRRPTCSHEHAGVGYDGMQNKMQSHLHDLFAKNNITVKDISAAAFGLAGADLPHQHQQLKQRITNMGLCKFDLGNDGILGVKAMADSGICAINGSGTVVVGIDDTGAQLQVGGIGPLSGDYAGGSHIARSAVEAVYKHYFRVGPYSHAFPKIMGVFGVTNPPDLPTSIISQSTRIWENAKAIIDIVDDYAIQGDEVCKAILDNVGINCAEGISGCIRNLSFASEITVVKAGSIWTKLKYKGMSDIFESTIKHNIHHTQNIIPVLLDAPPALGAVFWAMELINGKCCPQYREDMRKFLTTQKYENLVKVD